MTAIRIAPPAVLAVDLTLIKGSLGIDGDYMNDEVTGWARGVIRKIEHEIGQCLMAQTWRVTLDAFTPAIVLPHPVIGVVSVKYIDQAGAEQVLTTDDYRVRATRYQSTLVPGRGACWPTTLDDTDVVTIEVQCGYGAAPEFTPEDIQLHILTKLREQYDSAARMERDTVQSNFIDHLLDSSQVYG